jgi:hypothetical protein
MVVPELLATKAYVPAPVRVKIIDPEAIFLTGLLGESGRRLVQAGVEFYFTKKLAKKLIDKNIAVELKKWPISKYVGKHPNGEWVFVKEFYGTLEEALKEAGRMQEENPKTGRKKNHYRLWDQR